MEQTECEEWRAMAEEAIDVALHWKGRALAAERRARVWKSAAKRERKAIAMARLPIHPGEILADELAERQMSAAELALALQMPYAHIREILRGQRRITADTASRLSQWIGASPEFWVNLQEAYDSAAAD